MKWREREREKEREIYPNLGPASNATVSTILWFWPRGASSEPQQRLKIQYIFLRKWHSSVSTHFCLEGFKLLLLLWLTEARRWGLPLSEREEPHLNFKILLCSGAGSSIWLLVLCMCSCGLCLGKEQYYRYDRSQAERPGIYFIPPSARLLFKLDFNSPLHLVGLLEKTMRGPI